MKCLVTGGAGFIGSHLAEAWVKKGAWVRILDNFSSGNKNNLLSIANKIELICGDILDRSVVKTALQGIDYVFHQAALKTVPESFNTPQNYNQVNIDGTLLLLEESLKNKVKKFVYASSSSVYGNTPSLPKKETDALSPISPYAVTKLAGEYYCSVFSNTYHLPTISLRYFNVFGPRQPERDGYSPVIPKFISSLLKNESPPIYGDGLQSRDFTYIDDVVLANMLAVEREEVTGVFNVGKGENQNLLTMIQVLNKFLNKDIKPRFLPSQKGDVKHTLASIEAIQKRLGYRPTCSFEEGLKRTLAWFQTL